MKVAPKDGFLAVYAHTIIWRLSFPEICRGIDNLWRLPLRIYGNLTFCSCVQRTSILLQSPRTVSRGCGRSGRCTTEM